MKHKVMVREAHMVNTDPQRRCYDGCNFSEEKRWTAWSTLSRLPTLAEAEESAASWRNYMKGTGRECQYKVEPCHDDA